MKKMAVWLSLLLFLFLSYVPELAQAKTSSVPLESKQTSVSATTAIPTPTLEKTEVDLTVPGNQKGNLDTLLEAQKVEGFAGFNFLKLAIRQAVKEGVSPNTLVVLFLFPLVAGLVAFSRQVLGISGFGIIMPALLSVAFLSTGAMAGLVLLAFIVSMATLSRMIIKRLKVPYLPKLAMLIWMISLEVLGLLLVSSKLGLSNLMGVGIFPILLFVLLAEQFIEAQITRSLRTSLVMTAETVVLALISYKVMSASVVQRQVLLNPEISVILILAFDYLVGRYEGLRLMEVWRFRKMLKK